MVQGETLSSTHVEKVAAIVMAVALRNAGTPASKVTWWCDNLNTVNTQTKHHPRDPTGIILSRKGTPKLTWARGHTDNAHINCADRQCDKARDGRHEVVPLEYFLAVSGVDTMVYYREPCVSQTEEPVLYIRRVLQHIRNKELRPKLLVQAPDSTMNAKVLRKLTKHPGACDILQSLVRRAVLPRGTKEICCVPGCGERATAEHVLTANDAEHIRHFGSDIVEAYPGRRPKLSEVLGGFATSKLVMRLVSARLQLQEAQDTRMTAWCRRLIRSLAAA